MTDSLTLTTVKDYLLQCTRTVTVTTTDELTFCSDGTIEENGTVHVQCASGSV